MIRLDPGLEAWTESWEPVLRWPAGLGQVTAPLQPSASLKERGVIYSCGFHTWKQPEGL